MFDQPYARVAHWLGYAAITTVLCATAAQAQPAREADYELPAQELARSLREVSVRSGISVIAPSELVSGKQAPPLSGRYDVRQAVELLLKGSGLRPKLVGDAIVISRDTGPAEGGNASAPQPEDSETIVVTGTHVRGGSPTSSLIKISRREIERTSPASVEELMRNLPQNVSGGVACEVLCRRPGSGRLARFGAKGPDPGSGAGGTRENYDATGGDVEIENRSPRWRWSPCGVTQRSGNNTPLPL